MTSLAHAIRSRRESARSRRALMRAIDSASTPSAREDLLIAMQRSQDVTR
ncbi:hypothetical protein HJ588_14430 [Flexivirga sp. ID2601S]|uniref:Uncharacterized protein n=1 Tax=Flexivirga aerilata TaxID=1656889 RepID=A0A849AUU3_9MICO|nr:MULTISPECIES: hypothetical protein [Flexivirga]NNG40462.1 hypothetical protein [Flexivirga aerilata]